jgi:transcriptional regulator
MYNPPLFVEERIEMLHSFIHQHPLATVITCGPRGLEAAHVPIVMQAGEGSNGILQFHMARANEQWMAMESSHVLAIFGGTGHYVSPSWYRSKEEHGRVVPTWNYIAVHVRGQGRLFEQHDKLLQHLHLLTDRNESNFEKPWSVADAPRDYIDGLSKAIVGVEVAIETIEGKWKLSQNRSEADRQGVIRGLTALDSPSSRELAQIMTERNPK